jgi:hypothetical protein
MQSSTPPMAVVIHSSHLLVEGIELEFERVRCDAVERLEQCGDDGAAHDDLLIECRDQAEHSRMRFPQMKQFIK